MRIEINEEGFLLLERGKEMKEQYCPYCQGIIDACGDWCPHFTEPVISLDTVFFHICSPANFRVNIKDFTDRRVNV